MKSLIIKNIQILCLVAYCCFMCSIHTQAQIKINAELFNKTWKVDFDQDRYIKNMSQDEWTAFISLTTTQRHTLVTSMSHEASLTTFEFKADRRFVVRKSGEILEEGEWVLQPDGKTIIAKNDKGFEDIIELLELSMKKMVFNSKEYGQELVLVPVE
ncbi:MAG: hypothetical protein NW226_12730 [Microscillaceae bacterium]|nr:hypothetical protein [Microscillaceae bacterium]